MAHPGRSGYSGGRIQPMGGDMPFSYRSARWIPVLVALAAVAATGILLASSSDAAAAEGELTIVHAAVRQGDGALYRGPCGEVAVIDTPAFRGADMVAALDRHAGTRSVAWMAASHYHADHVGGLRDVASTAGVEVDIVYDRGGDRTAYDSATYRAYADWLAAPGSPQRTQVRIGDVLTLCSGTEEVRFRVLSVGIGGAAAGGIPVSNEDDHSVCMRVEFGDFRQATCGDLSGTGAGDRADVESVVAPDMGPVHVARISHHGSANSSNTAWVSALEADHAVISVGANGHGHPATDALAGWESAGSELWQTHRGGPAAEGGNDLSDGDVVITTAGFGSYTIAGTASGRSDTRSLGAGSSGPERAPTIVAGGSVTRLSGPDRFSTGADAAARLWPQGAATVLLATGFDYPDALAGGPLAAHRDAPLLLATTDALPGPVRDELVRLDPDEVILLGGTGALSTQLEGQVAALPGAPRVTRIAGSNRFDTAEAVAHEAGRTGVGDVVIATGLDYPDAVAAGALNAGVEPVAVTLATSTQLVTSLVRGERGLLIGGTGVLDAGVEAQARSDADAALRLSGPQRFATSQAVADFALTHRLTGRVPLVVATGQAFPDALSAGAVTARTGGPLLLIPTAGPTPDQADWISANRSRFTGAIVLGGPGAVSDAAVSQLRDLLTADAAPPPPPPPAPSGCVDVNTEDDLDELQRIVNIGPERAPELIAKRPYASLDDLARIDGIGPARVQDIKDQGLASVQC